LPTDPIPAGTIRHPGGCLRPVLLRGRVDHIDGATGELLHRYTTVHEPGGALPIACKTRRASRCPPCAEVCRADTYQLIRAGLSGGKGVPDSVATHPCVFTTLTAPSFGPVHAQREKDGRTLRCRPRRRGGTCLHSYRLSCPDRHARDDPRIGKPLCADCYDYTGAVLFNSTAPELWRRFTITLRRSLARLAGLTGKAMAAQVRVSFAKVAGYQRRGVVHFHAIIRLDGPAGPTTAPPAWASLNLLTAAIGQAARAVHLETPAVAGMRARTMAWGRELDTRPITTTGELTESRVAAYVAKYATKAAECTGTRPTSTARPPLFTPTGTLPGASPRRSSPHGRCGMTRLLLTVPEAAKALAISRSKLYELLASGAVASIRIDGSRRIPLTALEEYIAQLLAERKAA
jgi:excisionase family DNA binding protein